MNFNFSVLEGARRKGCISIATAEGVALPPDGFRLSGGLLCPGGDSLSIATEITNDCWAFELPALHVCRVPWLYQLRLREEVTQTEWLVAQGEVEVLPRISGADDTEGICSEVLFLEATVDAETVALSVELGESTAAVMALAASASRCAGRAAADATAAQQSASAAQTAESNAAQRATEAATSAEQVVESAGTINAHDVYWAAWFKRQTDLDSHFFNTKLDGFNYELPNLKIGRYAFFSTGLEVWSVALPLLEDGERMFANCPFTEWNVPLPKLQNANVMFGGYKAAQFSIWTVDLPSLMYAYVMFEGKPLTEFHGILDKLKTAQGMFTRCPALSIFDSALTALSDAPEMFNLCILNKESALNVFTTLPTYTSGTHRITVGIHIDHQGDVDIANAVADAEGKGWTVTVQWNGTASAAGASTWGLRRQTIFARVIEREAVDGSMCRVLDWGHYVTDPAGYEEFSSVEAAQQALGLTDENN